MSEKNIQLKVIDALREMGYIFLNSSTNSYYNEKDANKNFFRHIERLNPKVMKNRKLTKLDEENILRAYPKTAEQAWSMIHVGFTAIIFGKVETLRVIDLKDFKNNVFEVASEFEVLSKYEGSVGFEKNRMDIVLFINGVPIMDLELKSETVEIEKAINQTTRYTNMGVYRKGILRSISMLAVSNNIESLYYAVSPQVESRATESYQKKNQIFKWADFETEPYYKVMPFIRSFCNPETFLKIVLSMSYIPKDDKLFVLRPYQFYGANELFKSACNRESAFVWHSTGSGKTYTSAVLVKMLVESPKFNKVVLLLDRIDLADQTIDKYNEMLGMKNFSLLRGKELAAAMNDDNCQMVVTTIQSYSKFVKEDLKKNGTVPNSNIAFIVDECHRSTNGSMLKDIKRWADSKTSVFLGFTGTPVLAGGANSKNPIVTTEDIFGKCVHSYGLGNAIIDRNILPLYVQEMAIHVPANEENTLSSKDGLEYFSHPVRMRAVIEKVLESFVNQTTIGQSTYSAMFACDGKNMALKYYRMAVPLLRKMNKKCAVAFSLDDNQLFDGVDSHTVFRSIFKQYDQDFGTSFFKESLGINDSEKTNYRNDGFRKILGKYNEDVAKRTKSGEINMLFVSDMFLTGFDAPIVNTIYLDKNIDSDLSIVQAVSRPNRLYDENKMAANVILFSDRDAMKKFSSAIETYADTSNLSGISQVLDYQKLISEVSEAFRALYEYERVPGPVAGGGGLVRRVNGVIVERIESLDDLTKVEGYLAQINKDLDSLNVCIDWRGEDSWAEIHKDFSMETLTLYINAVRRIRLELLDDDNEDDVVKTLSNVTAGNLQKIRKYNAKHFLALLKDFSREEGKRERFIQTLREALSLASVEELDEISKEAFSSIVDDFEDGTISSPSQAIDAFPKKFDAFYLEKVQAIAAYFGVSENTVLEDISHFKRMGIHQRGVVLNALGLAGYGVMTKGAKYSELCSQVEYLVKIEGIKNSLGF